MKDDGDTPLHLALQTNAPEAITLAVLNAWPDAVKEENLDKKTALHIVLETDNLPRAVTLAVVSQWPDAVAGHPGADCTLHLSAEYGTPNGSSCRVHKGCQRAVPTDRHGQSLATFPQCRLGTVEDSLTLDVWPVVRGGKVVLLRAGSKVVIQQRTGGSTCTGTILYFVGAKKPVRIKVDNVNKDIGFNIEHITAIAPTFNEYKAGDQLLMADGKGDYVSATIKARKIQTEIVTTNGMKVTLPSNVSSPSLTSLSSSPSSEEAKMLLLQNGWRADLRHGWLVLDSSHLTGAALLDAVVQYELVWRGEAPILNGVLLYADIVDLNTSNHVCMTSGTFLDPEQYIAGVKDYLAKTAADSSTVFDGITGNRLKTMDQLVEIQAREQSGYSPPVVFDQDTNCATALAHALARPTLKEVAHCHNGRHSSAAVLVKSAAGSGKTWLTQQLLHTIASWDLQPTVAWYVPLLIKVQRLAFMIRDSHWEESHDGNLVVWYIAAAYEGHEKATLLEALRRRRLLLLFDGIDEAADLKVSIQTFICKTLLEDGHRFLITSRPEGVTDALYKERFHVLDLMPYSDEQQRAVMQQQIGGKSHEFIENLQNFIAANKEMDRLNQNSGSESSGVLEILPFDQTFSEGHFLPAGRQLAISGKPAATVGELLEVSGVVQIVFNAEISKIAFLFGMPVSLDKEELKANGYSGIILVPLKGESRCLQKIRQKYLREVESGLRPGPAAAWLIDVVRCSVMCKTPAEMLRFLAAIQKSSEFTVVRLKNYFINLDPTHFRRLGLTVLIVGDVSTGRPQHYGEIQLHVSPFFEFKSRPSDHKTYEYFRTLFGSKIDKQLVGSTPDTAGWMAFDQRVAKWGTLLHNPVLMSLFVVLMKELDLGSTNLNFSDFPETQADLYGKALDVFIARKVADSAQRQSVLKALTQVSLANQLKGRREFTLEQLATQVNIRSIQILADLLRGDADDVLRIPTLKALDVFEGGSMSFQSTHLSLQEYLAAIALAGDPLREIKPIPISPGEFCKMVSDEFNARMLRFGLPVLTEDTASHMSRPAMNGLLQSCPNQWFQLLGNTQDAALLRVREKLSGVDTFKIKGNMDWASIPASIKHYSGLKRMQLINCGGLATICDVVRELQSLISLVVTGCSKLKELPPSVGTLSKLKEMDVSQCTSLTTLPDTLDGLHSLEKLVLAGCSKLKELPPSVGTLSKLKELDVAQCTSLTTLPDTLDGLHSLEKLETTIASLVLHVSSNNAAGGGRAEAVGHGIATSTLLVALNGFKIKSLLVNSIDTSRKAIVIMIGCCLATNTSLLTLALCSNSIGAMRAAAIGQGLPTNASLVALDLRNNTIGDAGSGGAAATIRQGVSTNASLVALDLRKSKINDATSAALGLGLASNRTLTTLVLCDNTIGNIGAAAIGHALATNTSLKMLNLNRNLVGDAGAAAIAKGLATNATLVTLSLEHNQIGNTGAAAIRQCVVSKATLVTLNLSHNNNRDVGCASTSSAAHTDRTPRNQRIVGGKKALMVMGAAGKMVQQASKTVEMVAQRAAAAEKRVAKAAAKCRTQGLQKKGRQQQKKTNCSSDDSCGAGGAGDDDGEVVAAAQHARQAKAAVRAAREAELAAAWAASQTDAGVDAAAAAAAAPNAPADAAAPTVGARKRQGGGGL